jgi:hypothetical protein
MIQVFLILAISILVQASVQHRSQLPDVRLPSEQTNASLLPHDNNTHGDKTCLLPSFSSFIVTFINININININIRNRDPYTILATGTFPLAHLSALHLYFKVHFAAIILSSIALFSVIASATPAYPAPHFIYPPPDCPKDYPNKMCCHKQNTAFNPSEQFPNNEDHDPNQRVNLSSFCSPW